MINKLRDGGNVARGEYLIMTISALGILIRIEGGIQENQKPSTYENIGGIGGLQHK